MPHPIEADGSLSVAQTRSQEDLLAVSPSTSSGEAAVGSKVRRSIITGLSLAQHLRRFACCWRKAEARIVLVHACPAQREQRGGCLASEEEPYWQPRALVSRQPLQSRQKKALEECREPQGLSLTMYPEGSPWEEELAR
ncbi:hypothetical protein NDU88_004755 [Pleurodeles waltl]|uniref:Uncharacterized protein n=1 Tax=Pleurodeles waltl TaxID=8319 RepID=A0AAV7QDL3_PLEWA|nr:hypothetical protein NDU88_004755 [Pleurodeles waltl]